MKIILVSLTILSLLVSNSVFAENSSLSKLKPLLNWVCSKMQVDCSNVSDKDLPAVKEMSEQEFLQFAKTFPMLAKLENKLNTVVAFYRPANNTIYCIKGVETHYLVHELVHFVQFKVRKDNLKQKTIDELEKEARQIEWIYMRINKN